MQHLFVYGTLAPNQPNAHILAPINGIWQPATIHGKLYASDGRHRANPTENYGKGGLLQGRKHMLSLTWNAPIEAFDRPNDFFSGVGVDGLYMHFHRANEFLGLEALPTFICNDVIKAPDVPKFIEDYKAHLQNVFG